MDNLESVEISDTRHDLGELKMVDWRRGLESKGKGAHQSQTICFWVGSRVLLQSLVGHPFREDAELMLSSRHTDSQQRQYVRVGYMFPTNNFSTKSLVEI